jgi:hypothetical protein
LKNIVLESIRSFLPDRIQPPITKLKQPAKSIINSGRPCGLREKTKFPNYMAEKNLTLTRRHRNLRTRASMLALVLQIFFGK